MKIPTIVAAAVGLLIVQCAQAGEAKTGRPRWVIVFTIIDRTTGKHLRQGKLGGQELEFNDLSECRSIVDRVDPPETDRTTSVLTCQKVEPGKLDDLQQDWNASGQA